MAAKKKKKSVKPKAKVIKKAVAKVKAKSSKKSKSKAAMAPIRKPKTKPSFETEDFDSQDEPIEETEDAQQEDAWIKPEPMRVDTAVAAKPIQEAANVTQQETMKKKDNTLAIVGLVVNALLIPGVGSIIGGKKRIGIIQLVLFLVSIPLLFIIIGIPLMFGVWVWGIVTGIQMIQETSN